MFRIVLGVALAFGLCVAVGTLLVGVVFLHVSETMRRVYEGKRE